MTPNSEREVTDYRPALEANVRRTVAIATLRRIYKIIAEREREMRLLRSRVLPIAAIVTTIIAALIWIYANPWAAN